MRDAAGNAEHVGGRDAERVAWRFKSSCPDKTMSCEGEFGIPSPLGRKAPCKSDTQ